MRGCDALGKRGADSAEAKAKLARAKFEDDWGRKRNDLQAKINKLEKSKDPKPSDAETLTDYRKQLADLANNQAEAKNTLEAGTWADLDSAAHTAGATNQINGWWREVFFVFASVVLSLGLLIVGWNADGPERWVSLIMLAIITFSLYIGGTAWMPLGR